MLRRRHASGKDRVVVKLQYKYAVALTAALGLFMAVLDNTIVNVSLAAMERDFHTTINRIQWVITGYFLAQAAVIPVAGYLGNRFGIKRLFIIALGIFTVGSLLCGLSPRFVGANGGDGVLIGFRVLQGIGGGMLFPLGSAIAFSVFPPVERAAASATISIPVLIAPALGPTVGGLIVDSRWDWPGIFFINVPVGILAIILIARVVRPDPPRDAADPAARGGIDVPGLVLSMIGVLLVVYAFTLVSQTRPGTITAANPNGTLYGWSYWLVWALLAAGLAILAVFAFFELRIARDPVLDLRLYGRRDFAVASLMTWVTRAVVFGSFFLIPLFLQQFRGDSAVRTGLILMAQGLGSIVGIQTAARLYDRIGPRALVVTGTVLMTASTVWLIAIDASSDARFFVPVLFLRGIAFGWSNLPLQTVALAAITGRGLPKATSLYNATAQIFSSIGVSVLSTLLVEFTTTHADQLIGTARAAGAPPANLALLAGAGAMSDVFKVIAIATGVVIFIGLFLPRRSLKQQAALAGAAQQASPAGEVPVMVTERSGAPADTPVASGDGAAALAARGAGADEAHGGRMSGQTPEIIHRQDELAGPSATERLRAALAEIVEARYEARIAALERRIASLEATVAAIDQFAQSLPPLEAKNGHAAPDGELERRIALLEQTVASSPDGRHNGTR
jgi:EmrB/QacA subfamily drug resistance transporter